MPRDFNDYAIDFALKGNYKELFCLFYKNYENFKFDYDDILSSALQDKGDNGYKTIYTVEYFVGLNKDTEYQAIKTAIAREGEFLSYRAWKKDNEQKILGETLYGEPGSKTIKELFTEIKTKDRLPDKKLMIDKKSDHVAIDIDKKFR